MNQFASLDTFLADSGGGVASSRTLTSDAAAAFRPLFAANGGGLNHELLHAGGPAARTAPQVELIQVEGRIAKIVVTCGCGERIELDCAY